MPGQFSGTVTLTAADTKYLLSDLIKAVDSTAEFSVSELTVKSDDTVPNTAPIFKGSSRMVSPGAGLPPVDYGRKLDVGDSFTIGQGAEGNAVDTSNKKLYYFMSTAAGQKMHVDTVVK